MTGDIARELEERGIHLRRYQPGEHRAPCPQCARGKRDDALAVRLDHEGGAVWLCHRCEFRGAVAPERECSRPGRPVPRQPDPEQHETLAPWGLNLWEQ